MRKQLMRLGANAWAGFLDFGAGAAIAAFVLGTGAPLWTLVAGAALGLLPDYIHVGWMWRVLRGKKITYDHHRTWSHRPLLMLGGAIVLAWAITLLTEAGGLHVEFSIADWSLVAVLCLLWHYFHDYPLGDGYLNWSWPLTPDRPADIDHGDWLHDKWLTISPRYLSEVIGGIACCFFALRAVGHPLLALLALIILLGMMGVWMFLTTLGSSSEEKHVGSKA